MTTALYPSSLAAWAIEAYQRFISPYKGFRCAHRVLHGRDSCSQFAKRVAVKRGVLAMFPALRRRFTECAVAAQVLDYESRERVRDDERKKQKSSQIDGCDPLPSCDCATVPTDGCGEVTSALDAVSAPADCAGAAGGGGADCVSCDLL